MTPFPVDEFPLHRHLSQNLSEAATERSRLEHDSCQVCLLVHAILSVHCHLLQSISEAAPERSRLESDSFQVWPGCCLCTLAILHVLQLALQSASSTSAKNASWNAGCVSRHNSILRHSAAVDAPVGSPRAVW